MISRCQFVEFINSITNISNKILVAFLGLGFANAVHCASVPGLTTRRLMLLKRGGSLRLKEHDKIMYLY